MTTIYAAMEDGLLILRARNGRWEAESGMEGKSVWCLAADPARPERVWSGAVGAGAWRSDDQGASWRPAGEELAGLDVSALAVGPDEEVVREVQLALSRAQVPGGVEVVDAGVEGVGRPAVGVDLGAKGECARVARRIGDPAEECLRELLSLRGDRREIARVVLVSAVLASVEAALDPEDQQDDDEHEDAEPHGPPHHDLAVTVRCAAKRRPTAAGSRWSYRFFLVEERQELTPSRVASTRGV